MSQASVELRGLAETAFAAINSGDREAFVALTSEDVEFTSMVAESEGTTFRGHEGVRAWWRTVRGAFEDVRSAAAVDPALEALLRRAVARQAPGYAIRISQPKEERWPRRLAR
jgi:ketosteroid isomerase-like protein